MRIASALLCDAASIREGLMHTLGGGVSMIGRDSFPAPLGVTLAVMVQVDAIDIGRIQKFTVTVRGSTANEALATIEGGWELEEFNIDPEIPSYLPIVLNLDQVALPEPGYFRVTFDLDGVEQSEIKIRVDAASSPGVG